MTLSPELNDVIAETIDRYHAEKEAYFKANPPTNADRIRSMTDEELAAFIWRQNWFNRGKPPAVKCYDCKHDSCRECWLNWLQSPAEEVEDGD